MFTRSAKNLHSSSLYPFNYIKPDYMRMKIQNMMNPMNNLHSNYKKSFFMNQNPANSNNFNMDNFKPKTEFRNTIDFNLFKLNDYPKRQNKEGTSILYYDIRSKIP